MGDRFVVEDAALGLRGIRKSGERYVEGLVENKLVQGTSVGGRLGVTWALRIKFQALHSVIFQLSVSARAKSGRNVSLQWTDEFLLPLE